jgi:hypothetical protein
MLRSFGEKIIVSTIYCVWLRLHDFKWDYEEMTVSSEFFRGTRIEYLEDYYRHFTFDFACHYLFIH